MCVRTLHLSTLPSLVCWLNSQQRLNTWQKRQPKQPQTYILRVLNQGGESQEQRYPVSLRVHKDDGSCHKMSCKLWLALLGAHAQIPIDHCGQEMGTMLSSA